MKSQNISDYTNEDDKFINFSTILKASTLILWIMFSILFTFQKFIKVKIYADFKTFLVITLFSLFLYIFISSKNEHYENSLRLGIGFILIIIFLQRIIFLTIYPIDFEYNFYKIYTLKEFNYGIFAFSILLFASFIAIKTVKFIPLKEPKIVYTLPSYTKIRYILYIIAYLSLIISINLGYFLNWKMGTKWEYGWLSKLFPNSLYTTMMVLLWVFYGQYLKIKDKILISIYLLLTIMFGLIQGSRSGIFGIVMTFFNVIVVVKGNFKISKNIFIILVIINLILGPSLWFVGNAIRYKKSISYIYKTSSLLKITSAISYRVGSATDDFLIEVNNWGDKEIIKSLFTLENVIKAGINAAVPGEVFKDAPFESSGNLWLSIFMSEQLGSRVQGTVWSGFGFMYTLFGKWVLLHVFLWFLLVSYILRIFIIRKTIFHNLIAVYIYNIFIIEYFMNGNLDAFVAGIVSVTLLIFILYFIIIIGINALDNPVKQSR